MFCLPSGHYFTRSLSHVLSPVRPLLYLFFIACFVSRQATTLRVRYRMFGLPSGHYFTCSLSHVLSPVRPLLYVFIIACFVSRQATTLRVQGGGIIHSTSVNIEAETLIVDDLGEIIGDLHSITCTEGAGNGGSSGSGQ